MQLVGLPKLEVLKLRHAAARSAVDAWRVEVERAAWRGPQDIKDRYSTASFLADNRVVFNIKGNSFRLVVKVRYQNNLVLIEWAGTHAEYDKLKLPSGQLNVKDQEMKQQVRVIKTERDYDAAVARLSALMDKEIKSGSTEEGELELLALVIESFERAKVAPVMPDPIDAILFRMDQQGLAHKDMEPFIGSASKVSEVLSRKRPLSLAMIRRLHKGLGIPADVLIGAGGEDIDLSADPLMDYTRFPLQEMHARGLFANFTGNVNQLKDYAEDLVRSFMRTFSEPGQPALLRAPLHQSGARVMDEYALRVWQLCVLKKARGMRTAAEYRHNTITDGWLRDLAKLSAFEHGPRLAHEYLRNHGIALVIEDHFDKTYLDGAAMLDGGAPIVALTLRHDRVDNFWFALLHECVHVQKHLTPDCVFIADNLDDKTHSDKLEDEANAGAGEALIPNEAWMSSSVRISHSAEDAAALAYELRIHPAIVAGRVRRETGDWRLLSGLITSAGKVRPHFQDVDRGKR